MYEDARERRIELRNAHQATIGQVQTALQIYPTKVRPEDCGRLSSILTRLQVGAGMEVGWVPWGLWPVFVRDGLCLCCSERGVGGS